MNILCYYNIRLFSGEPTIKKYLFILYMATFQTIVSITAFIVLIIVLIIIATTLYKGQQTQTWPPIVGDCPDYWVDTSGNGGNCVNMKNLGTCKSARGKMYSMDFTGPVYSGSDGLCAKYKWATQKCNVTWDGITYGVPMPCK